MLRILFLSWHNRPALVGGVNHIWSSTTWPSTSPAWFSGFFSIQLKVMRAPFKDKTLHLSHLITPHQLFIITHRASTRLGITHPISFHYRYSYYIVPIYKKPGSLCIYMHSLPPEEFSQLDHFLVPVAVCVPSTTSDGSSWPAGQWSYCVFCQRTPSKNCHWLGPPEAKRKQSLGWKTFWGGSSCC